MKKVYNPFQRINDPYYLLYRIIKCCDNSIEKDLSKIQFENLIYEFELFTYQLKNITNNIK